jgi:hypothetical protein
VTDQVVRKTLQTSRDLTFNGTEDMPTININRPKLTPADEKLLMQQGQTQQSRQRLIRNHGQKSKEKTWIPEQGFERRYSAHLQSQFFC